MPIQKTIKPIEDLNNFLVYNDLENKGIKAYLFPVIVDAYFKLISQIDFDSYAFEMDCIPKIKEIFCNIAKIEDEKLSDQLVDIYAALPSFFAKLHEYRLLTSFSLEIFANNLKNLAEFILELEKNQGDLVKTLRNLNGWVSDVLACQIENVNKMKARERERKGKMPEEVEISTTSNTDSATDASVFTRVKNCLPSRVKVLYGAGSLLAAYGLYKIIRDTDSAQVIEQIAENALH